LKFLISAKKKYQFDKNKYQNRHQVEKYNDFINDSLSIDSAAVELQIYGYDIAKSKKKILGINPGASYGSAKRWYPQEFAKVARELSSEYDVIIFGGPGETDIAGDIEQALIDSGVTNYKNLAGNTTITELIDQISNLDLFITGDSGPMHVAAAFQVPTVAIFGPTKDKETSQWMNKKSIIVKKNLDCQPCMKRTCPLQHHNCMNLIKAIDVLKAINSIN
jgi:heptosyltransferase-2